MSAGSYRLKPLGFTLLELMITLTVMGLVLAVAAPAANKMYQSMQYREAVRDVHRALLSARYAAMVSGRSSDVVIDVDDKSLSYARDEQVHLPAAVDLTVESAAELMQDGDKAVIRFYSDGSSSGGSISLGRNERWIKLHVGWLLGRVEESVVEL